jgi:hypothetical protein
MIRDDFSQGLARLTGNVSRYTLQSRHSVLNTAGFVRVGPPREVLYRFVDFPGCGETTSFSQHLDRLLRDGRKGFRAARNDPAVFHSPADTVFAENFIQRFLEVLPSTLRTETVVKFFCDVIGREILPAES